MLTVNKLSKTYSDGTRALCEVDLTLPVGMVGLLGPNGAGKTSLMRTLATIQQVDFGDINFNGISVLDDPVSLRAQLGYLPQHFGVYPNMSCKALLEHIAVLKGLCDRKSRQHQIEELLDATNLSHVANKSVTRFSGGMRQRFGIAQALLGDPKLVIMDEPTAGLDPEERERLHHLLVDLSRDRLVLLSTHIVEDIENLCCYAAIIVKGRISQSGKISSLLEPIQTKVWRCLSRPDTSFPILSSTYRFGQPEFRVLSEQAPTKDAVRVTATLQDVYLHQITNNRCVSEDENYSVNEVSQNLKMNVLPTSDINKGEPHVEN